jgi:hypothetical protein
MPRTAHKFSNSALSPCATRWPVGRHSPIRSCSLQDELKQQRLSPRFSICCNLLRAGLSALVSTHRQTRRRWVLAGVREVIGSSAREKSTADGIARTVGAPISLGTATPSSKETFHGQARRQDCSHQRRHQRYWCGDRQTLSIRRRNGGRYRLQRALGGNRQGSAARDRGGGFGRRRRGRHQSPGRPGQVQTRPH